MTATFAFLLGISIGWTAACYRFAKRQSQADELRFLLAPVVQHSTLEDAARRAGC